MKRTLTILCLMCAASNLFVANSAEPRKVVLTSGDRGIHLDSWEGRNPDFKVTAKVPWGIRKFTLHGGKQEGVDIIEVDNGKMQFRLSPTRGMGILRVQSGDVSLGWQSPVKEVVHPQYINLQSRGGLGWLEGFNEWMVRCGLEFAGHPGRDKFINNVGDEAEMDLTLHGKIANIPASEVEVEVDAEPPHRIHIRGRVDERMFYGPKLELWTDISTEPNSSTIQVADTISNKGAFDQEFQLIYHCNYGAPLLERGARFVGAVKQVTPFNAHAAKSLEAYAQYDEPVPGFIEQVYCIRPLADASGQTTIMLKNAAADRGVSMTFLTEQLPYLTLWKNTTALEEGYVTGLEPGTGFPANRRLERLAGRVPKLAPGQSRQFVIDFTILKGKEAVKGVQDQIAKLQEGQSPQVDSKPLVSPP